jgi:diguanylate cyclase (GGDEF)-like protein
MTLLQQSATHESLLRFAAIYYFSPFVLAAGVGFFPLTLLEAALLLVAPIVTAMYLYIDLFQAMVVSGLGFQILWILILTLATSAMASVSQIGFLLDLFKGTAYDKLTGLSLRKIGEINLSQQIAATVRNGSYYAVLLFDLDNFKQVNDCFGHDAGDHVLEGVGGRLRQVMRHQDIAVRWGGEEFLIALPNATKDQAETFLRRLAELGLGIRPDALPVTASYGIAEVKADQVKTLPDLIALADRRLYAAKRGGRNRYVLQDAVQSLSTSAAPPFAATA